ncbi:MAG: hypothetical protein IH589_04245 [Anaerolineales bacterium]|nr:hypothetical protein [Anaerolineales bacterium]
MADYDQHKQKVNTQVNAENVHIHLSNLVHQVWDELEPDLQDAFSMAYNQARRDGVNVIKTRYLIAALAKLNTESISEFLKHVPVKALPKPINTGITTERTILDENPTLSGCVEDSLKHLSPKASNARKLSSADLLVDIARYGTGNSVARLRNNGITEERVNEIVSEMGLDLINR